MTVKKLVYGPTAPLVVEWDFLQMFWAMERIISGRFGFDRDPGLEFGSRGVFNKFFSEACNDLFSGLVGTGFDVHVIGGRADVEDVDFRAFHGLPDFCENFLDLFDP